MAPLLIGYWSTESCCLSVLPRKRCLKKDNRTIVLVGEGQMKWPYACPSIATTANQLLITGCPPTTATRAEKVTGISCFKSLENIG